MTNDNNSFDQEDLQADKNVTVYTRGAEPPKTFCTWACALIAIHILSLSITCLLLTISILKTDHTIDLLRDQKKDLIGYLQSAEISVMRHTEAKMATLKTEIIKEIEKKHGPANYTGVSETLENRQNAADE